MVLVYYDSHCLHLLLLSILQDIFGAHIAYLCSGSYPSYPSTSNNNNNNNELKLKNIGKYTLLGCDITSSKHRNISDCFSLSALRASELLEYALSKQLQTAIETAAAAAAASKINSGASTDGIAAISKSISGMLNWATSATSTNNNSTAAPPRTPKGSTANSNSTAVATTSNEASENISKLRQRLLQLRVVLCPLKVRFAILLADYGLLKEAGAYALDARRLIDEVGVNDITTG